MTNDELKALIESKIRDSVGYLGTELSRDRAKALDYYYGRKTGVLQAVEGRSSVVSRKVQEVIEWQTAQMVSMFTGEEFVCFEPEGQDDVAEAQQESEYVNYVIQRENEGFSLLHDWIKDGLLSRVGVVNVGYDDTPKTRTETYTGLTPEQLEMVLMEPTTELLERTERQEQIETPQGPQPIPVVDCRIKVTEPYGCVKINAIPPEEFLIERQARSIEDAGFVGHRYRVSKAKLKAMGVKKSIIDSLSENDEDEDYYEEARARDLTRDLDDTYDQYETKYWVTSCYIRADFAKDGTDELRHILYVAGEIAEDEPCEEVPYAAWCPVPMPHRFYGQSYADLVMDFQEIDTVILRQGLDNLYLANMPMKEVVDGQVNFKDLLEPRIGGIVRTKQIGMIREIVTTPMLAPALQMREAISGDIESRTGLTRYNQGLDPETLNKTASGMNMILGQSQLRVELVARIFAENGLKRLYKLVHGMLRRHQNIPRIVKLRNQFVPVNPTEWRERTNLTVTVGLGNGTRQQRIQGMQQIMTMQAQGLQIGIATPEHMYNAAAKMTELLGYKDANSYFAKPQPPDPNQQMQQMMQQAQMQAQAQAMVESAKERAKAEGRAQGEMQKLQAEYQMRMQEIQQREASEGRKLDAERQRAELTYSLGVQKLQQDQFQFDAKLTQEALLARERNNIELMGKTMDADIEREAMNQLRGQEAQDYGPGG